MTATVGDVARGARQATAHTLETTLDVVKGESFKTHWDLPPTLTYPVPEEEVVRPIVMRFAARYLVHERRRRLALDPVANFHLRNGASVWHLNWRADLSERGRAGSFGIMVNYMESYNINPFRWRGACFGRTVSECFWVGIHPTRWARSAYGGNLGARFRRGTSSQRTWKEVIGSLSTLYCWASLALGFGLGHLISAGGSWSLKFMSWFSCVTRQQLRRRFRLPATFGLPDGCGDCAVHTCCMYCASHQELRELAVRGVGGPGIHVLDVTPRSFSHVPGIEARLQQRAAELAVMEEAPVAFPPAPATPIPEEAPPPEVEMQRVP